MRVADLILAQFADLGVTLAVVDGKLRYHPADAVPADAVRWLRDHKNELLAILTNPDADTGDGDETLFPPAESPGCVATPPRKSAEAVWSEAIENIAREHDWPADIIEALRQCRVEWIGPRRVTIYGDQPADAIPWRLSYDTCADWD